MFDLEQAISQWRREMRADGIADAETLDELESHLRDDVEDQTRSGSDLQLSFEAALTRMGQRAALQKEFQKVTVTRLILRLKQAFRALAGIPDYQLAMNMNASGTNPNFEVRWATYAKAAAFLAPALALWAFSCVFLVPKLKQISGRSEEQTSELQSHSFISYAVFCLKKKNTTREHHTRPHHKPPPHTQPPLATS